MKAESREQEAINYKQAVDSAVVMMGRPTAWEPAICLKFVIRCLLLSALCLLSFVAPALAQVGRPVRPADIRFEQRLDSQVPLDLGFRDETGRTVRLGDYFSGKPVILALVYYDCPMLCNQVLNGLTHSLKTLSFDAGKEFEVVVVSFNPRETPELASAKKETYLRDYGRPGTSAGWHYLTGDPRPIDDLTRAAGFRYVYDPALNQYAHASGIMILTPRGRLSRYFYGIEYPPRNLRLGLIEASENRIGTPVDELLLLCYHYDPATGKYSAAVMRTLRVGGVLICFFVVILLTFLGRKAKGRKQISSAVKPINLCLSPFFFLLPFAPEDASTVAGSVDALYIFLVAIAVFFSVLIAGLEIFFAIKYRRRSPDEFPAASKSSLKLELAWTIIPFAITMVIFVWGAKLYFDIYRNPGDALDVYVTAKQWMWRFQHTDGKREINELHVPVGRRVKLIMSSEDVIHSFYVPAFRVKTDVVPGKNRYTTVWFEATKPGRYHLFCAEYCGTSHSRMIGWVDVMEPAEHQAWLGGGAATGSLAASGEQLFQQQACATCHRSDGTGRGPRLEGLFGGKVTLDNGQTVTADESYLRESILNPQAKIVAGYPRPSDMPTFDTLINEEQLLQLVAYIKSIGPQSKEGAKQMPGKAAGQPKQKGVKQ
ncbi:MAG TPA: cytochrome c oxidase subunit II [Pyrinomonadaceae bacterium]|nr:cytochrome c oxidase subunit II [Pyrinomonadaceae bacterium]